MTGHSEEWMQIFRGKLDNPIVEAAGRQASPPVRIVQAAGRQASRPGISVFLFLKNKTQVDSSDGEPWIKIDKWLF